jgi:hypothetical protein
MKRAQMELGDNSALFARFEFEMSSQEFEYPLRRIDRVCLLPFCYPMTFAIVHSNLRGSSETPKGAEHHFGSVNGNAAITATVND